MKPLPLTFVGRGPQKGWNFTLIERDGLHAVYRKEKEGHESYEVIIVKRCPEYKLGDSVIEAHEAFPSPEEWGIKGWTCQTRQEALNKMRNLS